MEAIWEWECAWECAAQCPALHRWQGHSSAVCSWHCCLLPSHHGFWLIGAAPGWQQPDLSRPSNLGISAEVNPSITGTKDVRLLSHHQSVLAVSPEGYLRGEQLLYRCRVILGKCFQKLSLKDQGKHKGLGLGFLYVLIQIWSLLPKDVVSHYLYFKMLYPRGNTLPFALESVQPNFGCEVSWHASVFCFSSGNK